MQSKTSRVVKVLALVGAILTGASMIYNGDNVNGIGVIAASLSSASSFFKES